MSARPWMPLYVAEYMADTAHLGALESGAYLHLIFYYWQTGGLPAENQQLTRIAKVSTRQWTKMVSVLKPFFHDGWKHKRVDAELARASDISEKRRDAVNARRDRQATNEPTNVEQEKTHLHLHLQLQEEESKKAYVSETKISDPPKRKRNDYPEDFERFWKGYPTDPLQSKKEAHQAWKRLAVDDRSRATDSLTAFKNYCQNNPDYRPVHACRFIAQRRFDGFSGDTNTGRPPSGLSAEQRAAWVREQLARGANEADQGSANGSRDLLETGSGFRAA